jgi:16S rRNA (cytidine1402-2'-O)-methyltransferase
MKKEFSNMGNLYICSNHIGNYDDVTYNLINTLKTKVDYVYAEDTREFAKLARKYEINEQKVFSYHLFNEHDKLNEVIRHLSTGKNVAIISDRGTPVVNDPGLLVIREYSKIAPGNIKLLPGASAVISSFVLSGFSHRFMFLGFLVKYSELTKFKDFPYAIILFESPHRIIKLMDNINELMGPRDLCVCRELTKEYEEVIYCNSSNVPEMTLKGEFTIVIRQNS